MNICFGLFLSMFSIWSITVLWIEQLYSVPCSHSQHPAFKWVAVLCVGLLWLSDVFCFAVAVPTQSLLFLNMFILYSTFHPCMYVQESLHPPPNCSHCWGGTQHLFNSALSPRCRQRRGSCTWACTEGLSPLCHLQSDTD